ncbi:hypothetical protein [Micromonospora sp. NPDC049891]|uniref:hypothetical protein n=1 Tax=Micromonospora sp. NPDC049891 TaxID=3155655 RepID=UPI0033CD90BC
MAASHGKNAVFSLDNASGTTPGTLQDISVYVDNVSGLPGTRNLSEVTAFGDEGVRNIPGLENTQFTISGTLDPQVVTIVGGAHKASVTASFEYGPQGSGSGAVKYSGEAWVSDFNVDASVAEKVPFSATLQVDGVVAIGTYS